MEEIYDSVKHFKFHVLNMGIILITEIKVSTKLFFKQTQEYWMSFGKHTLTKVSEYPLASEAIYLLFTKEYSRQ